MEPPHAETRAAAFFVPILTSQFQNCYADKSRRHTQITIVIDRENTKFTDFAIGSNCWIPFNQ